MTTALGNSHRVRLGKGDHGGPEDGICVMDLASIIAGAEFTDRPGSVSPAIGQDDEEKHLSVLAFLDHLIALPDIREVAAGETHISGLTAPGWEPGWRVADDRRLAAAPSVS